VRVERMERRTPEGHRLKVVGLVIGGRGIKERLGLDASRTPEAIVDRELVDWERVLALDPKAGCITLRA
jgi:hypothetical protein